MAAIFAISRVVAAQEFVDLLPKLFELLFGNTGLRGGAFLCIAALAGHNVSGIDYGRLVRTAAYYVNSTTPLMSEFAAVVLKQHLADPDVDVDACVAIFVDGLESGDGSVGEAIDAFRQIAGRMSQEYRALFVSACNRLAG
jgi:hypothetical protein